MIKFKNRNWNYSLIFCILIFIVISCLTIYSAMIYLPNYLGNLALKQLMWYLFSFFIIGFIIKINKQIIYQSAFYIYITNLLLLFLLLMIGESINGSRCWFIIPGVGSIQPSEFMKIAIILMASTTTSKWLTKIKKIPTLKSELVYLGKIFLLWIIPSVFTFLEPDTGAVLIYSIIILSILIVSPLRKRWLLIGFFLLLILLGTLLGIYFLNQEIFVNLFGTELFYRIDRLLAWKNGTGMQLENALTAIGSSGIFGHGYRKTPIYFPESGTDFIFAVYASNFGLIGSILLIGVIFYFDYTIIKIAKNTKNITDKFLIAGVIGMLIYQQVQNIGMTLGIFPITGITLPFISYGGSSLLSYMIMIGIIFSIYYENNRTLN